MYFLTDWLWLTVTDCDWLWLTVTDCDWLWLPVTACDCLWLTVTDCDWLWLTVTDCDWLWLTVTDCDWLWLTVTDCDWLWLTVTDCDWLWLTVTDCDWLWLTVTDCDWLTHWSIIVAQPDCPSIHHLSVYSDHGQVGLWTPGDGQPDQCVMTGDLSPTSSQVHTNCHTWDSLGKWTRVLHTGQHRCHWSLTQQHISKVLQNKAVSCCTSRSPWLVGSPEMQQNDS